MPWFEVRRKVEVSNIVQARDAEHAKALICTNEYGFDDIDFLDESDAVAWPSERPMGYDEDETLEVGQPEPPTKERVQ